MKKLLRILICSVFAIALIAGLASSSRADWQKEAKVLGEIFKHIEESYLYPIDLAQCRYEILGFLNPLVKRPEDEKDRACLDKHSSFMTPEQYRDMQIELQGHFSGIGAALGPEIKDDKVVKKDGRIVVVIVEVFDGSPAMKAGLRAKDLILKVRQENETDGTFVSDPEDAKNKLRGKKGTKVFVTVERDGLVFELPAITRDDIKIRTVSKKVVDGICYIDVRIFADETAYDLEEALKSCQVLGPNPPVAINLRGNPGGELWSALEVLSYFSKNPNDVMLTIKTKSNEDVITVGSTTGNFVYPETCQKDPATGDIKWATCQKKSPGAYSHYRIVFLVDAYSASASEIVSGTMQDWGFTVIGQTTYGKGVGQTIIPLSDGSGLRLTTFQFLTGNKKNVIGDKGVKPNHLVEDTRKAPEDTATDKDAQFQKALELLKK